MKPDFFVVEAARVVLVDELELIAPHTFEESELWFQELHNSLLPPEVVNMRLRPEFSLEEIWKKSIKGILDNAMQKLGRLSDRMIRLEEILDELPEKQRLQHPQPLLELSRSRRRIVNQASFLLADDGSPKAVLTSGDGVRAAGMGSTDLAAGLREDFNSCGPETTLNEIYASAGRGLPIAVVDGDGKLVGNLDPRHIMEEMGRVENLIDDFEREVFM